jgi:hypothetical protein
VRVGPRQILALVLLAVFVYISAGLLPYFLNNLRLQRFVESLTQTAGAATRPAEELRSQVVERAQELGLPVQASDVQVEVAGGAVRIAVRYVVPVDLPGYGVKLHFAPSAGR